MLRMTSPSLFVGTVAASDPDCQGSARWCGAFSRVWRQSFAFLNLAAPAARSLTIRVADAAFAIEHARQGNRVRERMAGVLAAVLIPFFVQNQDNEPSPAKDTLPARSGPGLS
jgi:hypothetical protein